MHDIKDIRKNIEVYKKKFLERNVNLDVNDFNKKDSLNRELINKKEKLEQEKKFYQNLKINQILKDLRKFRKKLLF